MNKIPTYSHRSGWSVTIARVRLLLGRTPYLRGFQPMGAFRPWIEYVAGYGKDWERFQKIMGVKSD
jgi:hypothetical protein